MIEINKVHQGDCLKVMQDISDKCIDMILCDLPYGTTACKWDTIIPFEPLWVQYKRIIKDNGAIVLTASQPFTSMLVMSNLKWFKYEWIWEKENGTNFLNAKQQPLKTHENILVFSFGSSSYSKNICMKYNPQMSKGKPYIAISGNGLHEYHQNPSRHMTENNGNRFPKSNLRINTEKGLHPTQKPVALFEYLVKTYTNEGDLVLDNCAGSGTTGVACKNLNRNFILIEQEEKYCQIAEKRIKECIPNMELSLTV